MGAKIKSIMFYGCLLFVCCYCMQLFRFPEMPAALFGIVLCIMMTALYVKREFDIKFILLLVTFISYYMIEGSDPETVVKRTCIVAVFYILGKYLACAAEESDRDDKRLLIPGAVTLGCTVYGILNSYLYLIGERHSELRYWKDIWRGEMIPGTHQMFMLLPVLGLLFVAVFYFKKRVIPYLAVIGANLFFIYMALITRSRSLLIILTIVFVIQMMISLLLGQKKLEWKTLLRKALPAFGVVLIAGALLLFLFRESEVLTSFMESMGRGGGILGNVRFQAQLRAVQQLFDYPMGGRQMDFGNLMYAHNLWLDMANISGLIPFFSFVFYTVLSIWEMVRLFKRQGQSLETKCALFGVYAVWFLYYMIEPALYASFYFVVPWIFITGAVRGNIIMKKEELMEKKNTIQQEETPRSILGILGALIFVVIVMLALIISMKKTLAPQLNAMSAYDAPEASQELQIYLPETYYAATGLTLEIYNSQITNRCGYITEYNVLWSCDVGESLERKYSLTATEDMIGDHELKVSVYDNALNLIAERTCTLTVVKGKLQEGFSLLEIGDSLSCDGMLYRRLQGLSDDQLVFNGTRSIDGFLMEGRYAFSAEDYLNDTPYHIDEGETRHAFYNTATGRFDWNYYREKTGFYPDVVQIFLGTNNLAAGEANADDIVAIVDAIRQDDVMMPIYVVNTIYQGSQNGLGTWKAPSGEYLAKGWNEHEQNVAVFNLMVSLAEKLEGYEDVYLVPAAISMDSEYDYKTENKAANPYSEATEAYETDPVHPGKAGYYQIADVMFSTFCGTRNE